MNTHPKTESLPAVTVAAVVAILFGALGFLAGVLIEISLLLIPDLPTSRSRAAMPPGTKTIAGIVWLFLIAVAVFGIFIGIGILRRRNWARISILVWGGLMSVVSAITIPVLFLVFNAMPGMVPNAADASPMLAAMKWFSVLFYGIPLCVGIWWLVLFTRPRVGAAFRAPVSLIAYPPPADVSGFPLAVPPALSPKVACPLPLLIFAGFMIFSSISLLLFVLVPMTGAMPFFFFGYLFSGASSKLIFGLMGLVYGVSAVGIFKLKRWSLDTILALQSVLFINGILGVLSPRFLAAMQEAMRRVDAENPAFPGGNPFLTGSFFHTMLIFGLGFGAAVIVFLWYYRSRFLEAASAAKT